MDADPRGSGKRERDAAGITDPELRDAYRYCRELNAAHGKSYYAATLLLPPWKRPYVHALYGFARYADEIVDNGDPATREHDFIAWARRATADLWAGRGTDPVCRALLDTMRTWDIPVEHIEAFLESMRADLTVTRYETYDDLRGYMYGSAAVIGLQMLPILEPLDPGAAAHARSLGEAFQMTNFIRDVAEDLDRGRIYLPMEDLDRFGVTRAGLEARVLTPGIRDLLRFEIDRTREIYRHGHAGIELLAPASRPCIEAAYRLYGGILREVERAGYDILARRVRVGRLGRLRTGLAGYIGARPRWTRAPARPAPPAR